MNQAPLIELKNIQKQFGKNKIIFSNLNLSIYPKEIIGILGRNGCGKTTLVKILSGLIAPEKGKIFFRGKEIDTNASCYKSNISILGDANRSLYWNLSGRQNVEYFSSLMNRPFDKDFFYEFTKKMKMSTYIDEKVSNYSKGMKQKLMLLISLINTPQLVVLDEPLNGLDMESVCIIEDVISCSAKDKGISFLLTSHDKYFIDEVCTVKYEITEQGSLEKKENNCVTMRQITLFFHSDDFYDYDFLDKSAKMVDEKYSVYEVTFGLNDYSAYQEIAKGISDGKIKIISGSI